MSDSKFQIVSISGAQVGYGETIAGPKGIPHTLKFYFEPTIEVQCQVAPGEELPLEEIYEHLHEKVKDAVRKQIHNVRQTAQEGN